MGGNSTLSRSIHDWWLDDTWTTDEIYNSYMMVAWAPAELVDYGGHLYWTEPLLGNPNSSATKITLAERVYHIL
jgi:hypothetical protein